MKHSSSGEFELPLAAAESILLFTPEGERAWVPDWEPHYVVGESSEAPGTVFTTALQGPVTLWVIVDISHASTSATYARFTPEHHAGLVSVRCSDSAPGHSTISVSYDMSLLGDQGSTGFKAYAPEPFAEMMSEWSEMIAAYLDGHSPADR